MKGVDAVAPLEAVQFRQWGPWHAVKPDGEDRTFCGRNAIGAKKMWERWDEMVDRCKPCSQAIHHNETNL